MKEVTSDKEKKESLGEFEMEQERHNFVKKFILITRIHKRIMEREFNKTGVYRSQHQILMYVAAHPNASQKEIASLHHVSPATIAVTLKKMEKGGYLIRQPDATDNRFNQILLTDKGRETVETSRRLFRELEEMLLDGITEEEMQKTEQVLKHMFDNFIRLLPDTDKEDLHW